MPFASRRRCCTNGAFPLAGVRDAATPEALLLSYALTAMEEQLTELGAGAPWRALHDLARHPPRRVPVFAGFGHPTPARCELFAAWRQRGTPRRSWPVRVRARPAAARAPRIPPPNWR